MRRRSTLLNPAERDIAKLLKDQLEIWYAAGKLRYFRAHPIRLVTRNGKTFPVKVEESQLGAPDLFVFLPDEYWWIETKRPGEELKAEQRAWQEWAPHRAFKVNSVKGAYQVLDFLRLKLNGGKDAYRLSARQEKTVETSAQDRGRLR